ncbi:magnesium and cobalt transport protein CorA [Nonomuraea deserti]|uniref:Magnesium and cobalt transport protein CorA n=1 Tax=Nonomuraea deserti TaxID=1848322 RepID=A0A4R4VDR5_9ACTN|nr:magnesium and cobalt transport protein CorA [Nonomuraea deserti]TDD00683.1 magnesium and cobalt transport protein CorA [Nonomuraea deserti]
MIVDKAIYCGGVRETVSGDISDAFSAARVRGDSFLWIGLHEPTQEEFDLITSEVRLHPLAVEDAIHAHQRPKLERYDDTLFVVLKPLLYVEETSDIEVGEINLFLGDDFVISVRHGQANPLGGVRRRVESDPDLLSTGPAGVLYAICDQVVDTYAEISHEVELDLIALERRVFSGERDDVTADIYSLKREVLEFRTAQDPLVPVLEEIVKGRVALCDGTRDHFRDVLDHLLRVDSRVDEHNELLTSALSAHLALVGRDQNKVAMQQNADMRKISSWAAVIAVPTMIAGIYGMNFDHMPELHWSLGYPLSLCVMVVAVIVVHRLLRRSGWL